MAEPSTPSVLAYVFWHQPAASSDRAGYEQALGEFHRQLRRAPVPGLRSSYTLRVPPLPWLPGGGYEDWYLVDDFAALGVLNAAAVDSAHRAAHDRAAGAAGYGTAGLYALSAGQEASVPGLTSWFGKPAGMTYQHLHALLGPAAGAPEVSLWQRQLVLGPAPEFRSTGHRPPDVLGELDALTVTVAVIGE